MTPRPHKLPWVWELGLAALLGAAYSAPFVHTTWWWASMLLMAALAWRVRALSPARAAGVGGVFGTAWLGAGTWWLYISMHDYGGLPAWMTVLAVAALSAVLSLYLAAAMAAFARWRTGHSARDALLFAALWLLAEWARGVIFTGFPWVASGYAQVDGPLAALAPWVGVYGMGFVAAALASWPVLSWRSSALSRTAPLLALAGVLGALWLTGPAQFTQASGRLQVSLLQGNVPQNEKFAAELMPQQLAWTRDQLLAAQADLVLGPETVIPLLPSQMEPDFWEPLAQHFRQPGRAALIGLPLGDEVVGYTNSAAGLSAATAHAPLGFYRYDKHHLVPFGEFIPTGFHWFTRMMNIPLGDFNRGPLGAPSFMVKGERVAPNICYEDLFGEELATQFVPAEAAPTVLANISNIGWFGNTSAVAQHLNISRLRTLEFQRPMLRATNTGATVVIDHQGRVTHQLPPFTQGVLQAEVHGRTGLTPYAAWVSRLGLWPWLVLAGGIVGLAVRRLPPI